MLTLHPIFMFLTTLLSVYVIFLGAQRFLDKRRKGKPTFLWKRHVRLGLVALLAWLASMCFAITLVYLTFNAFLPPGIHTYVGLIVGGLALIALATGYQMNHLKRRRKWLPRLHGLAGLIAVILALAQMVSGWRLYIELTGGF